MKQKLIVFLLVMIGVLAVAEAFDDFPIREIVRYPTKEDMRTDYLRNGKNLMELKGIPDGDETQVCTNWFCPTSIVVNAEQYQVVTNKCLTLTYFKVLTTNESPIMVASGDIEVLTNGKVARCNAFAHRAQTSLYLPDYASSVAVQCIGTATNMLFVTYTSFLSDEMPTGNLVYKNIALEIDAPTNSIFFAAAIINEGLQENERIPLPPPQ